MKPTYTVRLTGGLDADERQRIAARVAGVTDIEADKIERLLERGTGRDLIKPSSANVANRLASVLAEAGAPIQLVPITGPESEPADAVEPDRIAPTAADEDILRPRQSGAGRDVPLADPADDPVAYPATDMTSDMGEEAIDEHGVEATDRPSAAPDTGTPPPPATTADAALPEPEPESEAAPDAITDTKPDAKLDGTPAPPPEPEVTVTPPADPGVRARPADKERIPPPPPPTVEPPRRPSRKNGGSTLLGAIGAAVLGIGAVFAIDLLVNPIAIGVLVLAVLALGLSLLGQRRAMWLPGLGALALVVWALANAVDGPMATLAANWQWYAMFAGSLLVMVAGFQEAQRGRGR